MDCTVLDRVAQIQKLGTEAAGVAVGQVIFSINNMPVKTPDEVREALLKTGLSKGKGCYLVGPL